MNRNTHLNYNCTFLLYVYLSLSLGCTSHSSCLLSLKRAFRGIEAHCVPLKNSNHPVHVGIPPMDPQKCTHLTQGRAGGGLIGYLRLLLVGSLCSPSLDIFQLSGNIWT